MSRKPNPYRVEMELIREELVTLNSAIAANNHQRHELARTVKALIRARDLLVERLQHVQEGINARPKTKS